MKLTVWAYACAGVLSSNTNSNYYYPPSDPHYSPMGAHYPQQQPINPMESPFASAPTYTDTITHQEPVNNGYYYPSEDTHHYEQQQQQQQQQQYQQQPQPPYYQPHNNPSHNNPPHPQLLSTNSHAHYYPQHLPESNPNAPANPNYGIFSTGTQFGSCNCNKDYAPVCGNGGQTYENACQARCQGVNFFHPGVCVNQQDNGKNTHNCNCPMIEHTVCAQGKDYLNACTADCEGHHTWQTGPCVPNPQDCYNDYDCEVHSFCKQVHAGHSRSLCTKYSTDGGRCGGGEPWVLQKCMPHLQCILERPNDLYSLGICTSPTPVYSACSACGEEHAPVCVNGRSFLNRCLAACEGYGQWTDGRCKETIVCKGNFDCPSTHWCQPSTPFAPTPKSPTSESVCVLRSVSSENCIVLNTPLSEQQQCAVDLVCRPFFGGNAGTCEDCGCGIGASPVCANGNDFASECLAQCAGHTIMQPGSCGLPKMCVRNTDCLASEFCREPSIGALTKTCFSRAGLGQRCTIWGFENPWNERLCAQEFQCTPDDPTNPSLGGVCAYSGACAVCPTTLMPVCATVGKREFINSCTAECQGIWDFEAGSCDTDECESSEDCKSSHYCKATGPGSLKGRCVLASALGDYCQPGPAWERVECSKGLLCDLVTQMAYVQQFKCIAGDKPPPTENCLDGLVKCTKQLIQSGNNCVLDECVVDNTPVVDPKSCSGQCGWPSEDRSCWCDKGCSAKGDCCHDYVNKCKEDLPSSCRGRCLESYAPGRKCYCDYQCTIKNDCCDDYKLTCGGVWRENEDSVSTLSCKSSCGAAVYLPDQPGVAGCYCDEGCMASGDCCHDFTSLCVKAFLPPPSLFGQFLQEAHPLGILVSAASTDASDYRPLPGPADVVLEDIWSREIAT